MSKNIFLVAFLFSALVFLAHYWVVGSGVWGDGRYYYSYVRSLIVDGDLNLSNEMEYFGEPAVLTKTGRVANKYAIGPAIFWLPFFLLAHLLIRGDGYSLGYQLLTGLGSVFFGVLGLYFCFLLTSKFFSKKIALIATLGIWLSSNLFFYTVVDPVNSHSLSFFTSSLIVYLWLGRLGGLGKLGKIKVLGLLIGILGMIRAQDLMIAIPITAAIYWENKNDLRKALINSINFIIFIFVGFLPQLVVWQMIFGEFRSPYLIYGHQFFWLQPKILQALFSQNNGLFYYSPILLLGLLGMNKSGLFLFFVQLYIIASWFIWWGGAAYGGRMFISLMPFFILGLAAMLEKAKRFGKIKIIIIISFIILNFYSMIKFLILSP